MEKLFGEKLYLKNNHNPNQHLWLHNQVGIATVIVSKVLKISSSFNAISFLESENHTLG
jgi:hypothetical protein